jgi:predicted DNA-binding transcriptional regulator AlpA
LEQKEYSQMALPVWERLTVPLGEFVELSGIGRTAVYKMMQSGELKSVTLGKKRMVIVASYRELLERAMREQASYTPGRHRPGRPRKSTCEQSNLPRWRERQEVSAPRKPGCVT